MLYPIVISHQGIISKVFVRKSVNAFISMVYNEKEPHTLLSFNLDAINVPYFAV